MRGCAWQVLTQQASQAGKWQWAEADLGLLLQQFKGLKVIQQYTVTQKQLAAQGPEGKLALAKAQMQMLSKVVGDFLLQLGPVQPGELVMHTCSK